MIIDLGNLGMRFPTLQAILSERRNIQTTLDVIEQECYITYLCSNITPACNTSYITWHVRADFQACTSLWRETLAMLLLRVVRTSTAAHWRARRVPAADDAADDDAAEDARSLWR